MRGLVLSVCVSIVAALGPSIDAFSQESPPGSAGTSNDGEVQRLDRGIRELDTAYAQFEAARRAELDRCVGAFGHQRFCDCIFDKIPVALDFIHYVEATAVTEADFRQAALTAETRNLAERARAARDQCVAATLKGAEQPIQSSAPPLESPPDGRQ